MSNLTVHEQPTIYAAVRSEEKGHAVYPCEIVHETSKSYRMELRSKRPRLVRWFLEGKQFVLSKADLTAEKPIVRERKESYPVGRKGKWHTNHYRLEFFTDRKLAEASLTISRDIAGELKSVWYWLREAQKIMEAITAAGGTLPPELQQILTILQRPEPKDEIEVEEDRPALTVTL